MREIKFRAWDKNLKIMLNKKHWLQIEIFKNKWYWVWRNRLKLDAYWSWWSAHRFSSEEIILMQYTWLKDKNWKEIYEGDIVKFDDWDNWEIWREEVKFINWAFSVACYHPDYEEFINEPRTMKVIWNIYENPNLIK